MYMVADAISAVATRNDTTRQACLGVSKIIPPSIEETSFPIDEGVIIFFRFIVDQCARNFSRKWFLLYSIKNDFTSFATLSCGNS